MPFMEIAAGEISSIQPVDNNNKNVVLLISQRNASRPLVVKSEDGAGRNNVGAMLEFHATAFSKLRGLPFETAKLSLKEIDELKRCDPTKVIANAPLTQAQWLKKLDALLHTSDGKTKTAIKVSFVEQLANLHGIGKDLEQKKLLGEALVRGNTDVPFGLGEILAVDFFIGNGDRFREVATSVQFPRGSILGDQNIFFQIKCGKFTTVGLDTYDGGGCWSDLNRTIEDLEATNKNMGFEYAFWPGRILAPGARRERDEVATALVDSLIELCLGKDAVFSASMRKKLIEACHCGISSGKEMLRGKYKLGDNVQSLTAGIRSRWLIIRGK
ncbi:hypothetical protein AWB68_08396 [Caballeronia choica]|jgi:hypothetical protein|uniref:Uncharacterized protein n=1 Tax=Caballeronia choica TaxID=326476 RepID=A0A158L382_9BURK|nr:hypothetical protein [Caballeronia choica]SAL87423.1 hypothetical protein AWB68_08396 [Caballeronia choica]